MSLLVSPSMSRLKISIVGSTCGIVYLQDRDADGAGDGWDIGAVNKHTYFLTRRCLDFT